jgi:hydroxyethylthiazole kinase-like uncharacterized protein yjeF
MHTEPRSADAGVLKKFVPGIGMPVMSREEVRTVDEWAIKDLGLPGVVLMENAGRSCAEFLIEQLESHTGPKVVIFCGAGNNGGDGFVIARHLRNHGMKVEVYLTSAPEKIKGDARVNYDVLMKMPVTIEMLDMSSEKIAGTVDGIAAGANFIVDAIFGTGLEGQVKPEYARLIEAINQCGKAILAVDIPSGLDCDAGQPLGTAIKAAATITFVAAKKGFGEKSAGHYAGVVYVAGIGIEPGLYLE